MLLLMLPRLVGGPDHTPVVPEEKEVNEDLAYEILDEMLWAADEIENETTQLMSNIRATEEVMAISLDNTRNQLINLNLFATAGAFVAAVGSMVASMFGMNLHVEEFASSVRAHLAVSLLLL